MREEDLKFVKTCDFAPEQYDVFDEYGKTVAYVRIRYGSIWVYCPNVSGEEVYVASTTGYGFLDDSERESIMDSVKEAICNWWNS